MSDRKRAGDGAFLCLDDEAVEAKQCASYLSLQIALVRVCRPDIQSSVAYVVSFMPGIRLAKRFDAILRLHAHEIWLNTRPNVNAGGRTYVFELI